MCWVWVPLSSFPQVCPITLYSDATPYTKTDSFYGFYLQPAWSRARYVLVALKKSSLCPCGCKGYCTLAPIFAALIWSLNLLAFGRTPSHRHDGGSWKASDTSRCNVRVAQPFGFYAAVIGMRGDWAEFSAKFINVVYFNSQTFQHDGFVERSYHYFNMLQQFQVCLKTVWESCSACSWLVQFNVFRNCNMSVNLNTCFHVWKVRCNF